MNKIALDFVLSANKNNPLRAELTIEKMMLFTAVEEAVENMQ
jgi:hypothetical protein